MCAAPICWWNSTACTPPSDSGGKSSACLVVRRHHVTLYPGLHVIVHFARISPRGLDRRADDDANPPARLGHAAAGPEIARRVGDRRELAMLVRGYLGAARALAA